MPEVLSYLKSAHLNLDPKEVLQSPVTVLRGIGPAQQAVLNGLGIDTVFELAASGIFRNAGKLLSASTNPLDPLNKFGAVPSDMAAQPAGMKVDSLSTAGVEILQGVVDPAALKTALGIETVRELALWAPYAAARDIMQSVYFPEALTAFDPEAPADLLPKSGEYPTERVYYKSLVLDEVDDEPQIDLEEAGQVDLAPLASDDFGFRRLGVGALLTFAQSWYAKGVTLGSLLHSVALAPGESTRIAMMDWSRTESGRQSESVSETEQLSNTTQHNRSISEVTSAVAQETQSGFSEASSSSVSTQYGHSSGRAGVQTEGMFEGAFNAVFGGGNDIGTYSEGTSYSIGTTATSGMAFSSSSGRRELAGSMSQNIADSTQQNASSARNRRASVVREVSQTESQTITTRVVANYNHMHALSIQYYEIVQVYSVEVQLSKVEKCLFVPMKLIDFKTNHELIGKFRTQLAMAALNRTIRNSLVNEFDTIRIRTPTPISAEQAAAALKTIGTGVFRYSADQVFLPPETTLLSINLANVSGGLKTVYAVRRDGREIRTAFNAKTGYDLLTQTSLNDLSHIKVVRAEAIASPVHAKLRLRYAGSSFALDLQDELAALKTDSFLKTFRELANPNLIQHFIDNCQYYSQAIFRSLDASSLALLLAPYKYKGKPVTQQIDPTPVTYVANYLVFKMHEEAVTERGEKTEWGQWLDDHGIDFARIDQQITALPSGGVFAEAVLGRYNSAEKLDKTRFWNWQDSPIPLVAPDIAPAQLKTPQASEMPLTPGGFGPPMVNIVNPSALPDPVGMAAAMQAIQNGNMFRDMSGLSEIIKLAQTGATAATAGATAAGQQAGINMKTAADNFTDIAKLAAQVAMTAIGKPSGGIGNGVGGGGGNGGGKPSNITNEGADLNYARDMDKREAAGAVGGTSSPAAGGSASAGGGGPRSAPSGQAGQSNEQRQFDVQTYGADGAIARDTSDSLLGLIPQDGFRAAPPSGSTIAWKYLFAAAVRDRIIELIQNPDLIRQGVLGLCGEAVFMRNVIRRDKSKFFSFANGLLDTGKAYIGALEVAPDADLRNANYGAIAAAEPPDAIPPQADWMILSALRDSENEWLDYEGGPHENFAESSNFRELIGWHEKSGLYSMVSSSSNRDPDFIRTFLLKTDTNHVTLGIDIKMIDPSLNGGHVISLESPLTFDDVNDTVTFQYWTWGRPVREITMSYVNFVGYYRDVALAEF